MGALLGAGLLVVVGWVAYRHAHPPITAELTGYRVVDARSVRVEFTVRKDRDRAARCVVRALDRDRVAVGSTIVAVPAGAAERDVTALVPTRRQAAAGEVTSCSLAPLGP